MDLDCDGAPWLGQIWPLLASGHPDKLVFDCDYATYWQAFRKASRCLALSAVPYQARHSGPSIYVAAGYRDKKQAKTRDRWKTDKSLLRYEQHARLSKSFTTLPPQLQYLCTAAAAQL